MAKRALHIRETQMNQFVQRIKEALDKGATFVSGRTIGCYLVANFDLDEPDLEVDTVKTEVTQKISSLESDDSSKPSETPEKTSETPVEPSESLSETVTTESDDTEVGDSYDPEVAKAFESKDELEEYGRKFGVELSKRKTLENMLKDLDEALSK